MHIRALDAAPAAARKTSAGYGKESRPCPITEIGGSGLPVRCERLDTRRIQV